MERKSTRWLLAGSATEVDVQDGETSSPEQKLFLTRADGGSAPAPIPKVLTFLPPGGRGEGNGANFTH